MDASFDINDFFPTTDPINPNARYSHADESFFPQLNTATAGSFQELTTDTNNKVTQIQELMKHKQDAQITEVVLPQLINMLINERLSVTYVAKSIEIIYKLVKVSAPFNAMCKNFELVPALLHILQDNTHIEQHQTICSILYTLSVHETGVNQLFRGQSITAMLEQMERSGNEKIVIYCSRILFNMQRQLKMSVTSTVRLAYGVNTLTSVLVHKRASVSGEWSDKFKTMLCQVLISLCTGDSESKENFHLAGGTREILRIIQQCLTNGNYYDKLMTAVVRLFVVITASRSHIKDDIIENLNGFGTSFAIFESVDDSFIRLNSLYAFRNLSDRVDETLIDGDGGTYLLDNQLIPVIDRMLELIGSDARDADTTENNLDESCAAGILCNITCNNKRYKEHIIAVGGTRILINQYISKPGKPSIAEPIVCTLRHLTARNNEAYGVRQAIGNSQMIRTMSGFIKLPREHTAKEMNGIKANLGLIRNLALNSAARAAMMSENVPLKIAQLLEECSSPDSEYGYRKFDYDDLIDGALGALHVLCRDKNIRRVVSGIHCANGGHIITLIRVYLADRSSFRGTVSLNRESIQREAAGLLCEMVEEESNQRIMEEIGIASDLSQMLNSHSESQATYAAATLYKLSGSIDFIPGGEGMGQVQYSDQHMRIGQEGIVESDH